MAAGASKRPQKRQRFMQRVNENGFNRLPDDLISSHILSRLETREAGRTSILSRRWRNLWIHGLTPTLIFRYPSTWMMSHKRKRKTIITPKARVNARLTQAINRILTTHYTKPTLDELTICYDFNSSSFDYINRWVRLAFRKGIKRFELDLFDPYSWKLFTFPMVNKLPSLHAGNSNLRELCLKSVNIYPEDIEFLVSNCCLLEILSVLRSTTTDNINICAQTTKLKSLEFGDYYSGVTISCSSLISLHYTSDSYYSELMIKHAPNLSELSIGGSYWYYCLKRAVEYLPYLSQLNSIKVDMDDLRLCSSLRRLASFPKLAKLEQLELTMKFVIGGHMEFYSWTTVDLIEAAPMLRRLSVELIITNELRLNMRHVGELEKAFKQMNHHQSLELIEFRGFGCHFYELELCRHLMHVSDALKEFIIIHSPNGFSDQDKLDDLMKFLPLGVELVVI